MEANKICRIILLVVLMAGQIAHAAPLAILTDVSGSVQVVRGGKNSAGRNGTQLQAGDMVRVEKGAATVYYATKAPQKIGAGQQVTVGASGNAAQPSPWRNVYAGLSQGFARRRTAAATVRPGFAETIAPAGLTFEQQPTFVWTLHNLLTTDSDDYLVTVKDSTGKIIWQCSSLSLFLRYPAPEDRLENQEFPKGEQAPSLEPGKKYYWGVVPRQKVVLGSVANPAQESQTVMFQIASPEQAALVRAELKQLAKDTETLPVSESRLIQAAALSGHGFPWAAVATLLPEASTMASEKGFYPRELDKLLSQMDEATQTLLRSLFLETGQTSLAVKIKLPDDLQDPEELKDDAATKVEEIQDAEDDAK